MLLRYNFDAVRINAELVWGEGTAIKMTANHFRQLDLVQWLEKNIGPLYDPVQGEMLHGVGWYVNTEFNPGTLEPIHYVDIDDNNITELQLTEFLLRFG